jgi:hypothetical protein
MVLDPLDAFMLIWHATAESRAEYQVQREKKRQARRFLEAGRVLLGKGAIDEADLRFGIALRLWPDVVHHLSKKRCRMLADEVIGYGSNATQLRLQLNKRIGAVSTCLERTPMECEWLEAGFFVVSGGKSPERGNNLLPPRIVTVSTCIVESYPDFWCLPWAETTTEQLLSIRESLALADSEFEDLRSWVGRAMDDGNLGWPNVFLSLGIARRFRHQFLGAIKGSRIVGLSLAKDVAAEFVREEGEGGAGVSTMLTRGVPLDQSGSLLGFDVLGAEYDGGFHTFSCNGLEQDFNEKLCITVNKYGLIDDYLRAVAACEYVNRDDTRSEPVNWYPFRVDEYPWMPDETNTGGTSWVTGSPYR